MTDYHKPKKPSLEELEWIKERYLYDPLTGKIRSNVQGREVGFFRSDKYKSVRGLYKDSYYCHHVAWYLHYGEWPQVMIDHVDQNKINNKIDNLRLAHGKIQYENRPKTQPGLRYKNQSIYGRGIYYRKGRYEVYIVRNKQRYNLGVFYELEKAQEAVRKFNESSRV